MNIHGDCLLKISSPEIQTLLKKVDILCLQETHLRPGQEDNLALPRGYNVLAIARPVPPSLAQLGGGVAIIYKASLTVELVNCLSDVDILTIAIDDITIMNAYIPPATANWENWAKTAPMERFTELLTTAAHTESMFLLLGDLNARTASEQSYPHTQTRTSVDTTINTRGRELLRVFSRNELLITNGLSKFPKSAAFTSFQPLGKSVIDYVIMSESAFGVTTNVEVLLHLPSLSDHAAVLATLALPLPQSQLACEVTHLPVLPQSRTYPAQVPGKSKSPLDELVVATIHDVQTQDEAYEELFGYVTLDTPPVTVYTDGSCHNNGTPAAKATAAIYWGAKSTKNWSDRVPGAQTNNRAELYAILQALLHAAPNVSLILYSDSEYALRSVAYWAMAHDTIGWECINGDIIQDICKLIKLRSASLKLRWVKAHAQNEYNIQVDLMANAAVSKPLHEPHYHAVDVSGLQLSAVSLTGHSRLNIPKVSCDLPDAVFNAASPPVPHAELQIPSTLSGLSAHRGRSAMRALQTGNLNSLLSCQSEKEFWALIKRFKNPVQRPIPVQLDDLRSTFQARMNPPAVLPDEFNAHRYRLISSLVASMPDTTVDVTPTKVFSRPWSSDEIKTAKKSIKTHNLHSAPGKDKVSNQTVLSIKNESLRKLYQTCIDRLQVPSSWMEAVIAAIPKKGKPANDPNGYRLIGLQSCLLKALTLLIDKRLREWALSKNLIPDSQNGFRPAYRTNNNSYILRCAIDKAKSEKLPLYVAFIDLSNAFPSTNQDALWHKLHIAGARGPIIDWLRLLYRSITYQVRLNGKLSEPFCSLIGILAGDPASPHLWNIFLADFTPPTHPDDIKLNGRPISYLAQADDIALFCTSVAGLQLKLCAFYDWCKNNFLLINLIKSIFMKYGLNLHTPSFHIGGTPLRCVEEATYVGVKFSSATNNVFAQHYKFKSDKAFNVSGAVMGVDAYTGVLPPKQGIKLYMACVDPHLISGAEVSIDTDKNTLKELEKAQQSFIRRLLALNSKSLVAPLYTETGVLPIKYRRVVIALRYLKYLLSLPANHLAFCALMEVIDLHEQKHASWFSDLHRVLQLTLQVSQWDTLLPGRNSSKEDIDAIIKAVIASCHGMLLHELNGTIKTDLLHNRMEKTKKGIWKPVAMQFRHYLMVATPDHRVALTHLLLSDHCLAIEQLRRETRHRKYVPRHLRICRFCFADIECQLHATLICTGNDELIKTREAFLTTIWAKLPHLVGRASTPMELFTLILREKNTISLLAAFVSRVLDIFSSVPIYVPQDYIC